jgi:hypothetical protein
MLAPNERKNQEHRQIEQDGHQPVIDEQFPTSLRVSGIEVQRQDRRKVEHRQQK